MPSYFRKKFRTLESKGDRLIVVQEIVKMGRSNVDSGSTLVHSDVE